MKPRLTAALAALFALSSLAACAGAGAGADPAEPAIHGHVRVTAAPGAGIPAVASAHEPFTLDRAPGSDPAHSVLKAHACSGMPNEGPLRTVKL